MNIPALLLVDMTAFIQPSVSNTAMVYYRPALGSPSCASEYPQYISGNRGLERKEAGLK